MKTSLYAIAAVATMFATNASAADLGGNCCADLEERVAELEATTARKGNRKVSLTVSGWVHESVLFWDDGNERNVYVVTNDVARTRFRFVGDAKINSDLTAGYLLEIGVRSVRSSRTNQNTDESTAALDIRHSAWWLQHKDMGKVWIGQTSEATDGITEITLANNSHMGVQIPDAASGFLARLKGGTAPSTVSYTALFMGGANQTPGEGDRFNVIKYETPTIMGFNASASWGEDDIWSVALRYAGEFSGFKVAGGVGYEVVTDPNSTTAGVNERGGASFSAAGGKENVESLGVSGSIMHVATGLFVYGAYGERHDKLRQAVFGAGADDRDSYWHVQGGIEKNFFGFGKSTLFGEYWSYNGGLVVSAAAGANNVALSCATLGGARCLGSEVNVWGIGFNQTIDAAAMDLYIQYRHQDNSVSLGNAANTVTGKANLEDFQYVMTGARIQF